jgi:3-oxoacyl-[acyl-carrier protein] reductase
MRAVITGGGGSLATALVEVLQSQDWQVLAPLRSELDVTQAASITDWFAATPSLDLLINAAGTLQDGPAVKMSSESWDRVLDVNLKGAFLCSQAAARRMASVGRGHVVLIGSASALLGTAGQANYAAAKAGLTGLTKSLAAEWGPQGIRVNCVLPGWLDPSRMTGNLPAAARTAALAQHVLGKFNSPQHAARFIAFLHSMDAVSGQVFQLDSRLCRA